MLAAAENVGVPLFAIDGRRPSAAGGTLQPMIGRNDRQPTRGALGANELLDQFIGVCVFDGEPDRDSPMHQHGRQTARRPTCIEDHRGGLPLVFVERFGYEIQQRQPRPLEPARPNASADDAGGVHQVIAVDKQVHRFVNPLGHRRRIVILSFRSFNSTQIVRGTP